MRRPGVPAARGEVLDHLLDGFDDLALGFAPPPSM